VNKCPTCESQIKAEEDHNCIQSLVQRFEKIDEINSVLKQKILRTEKKSNMVTVSLFKNLEIPLHGLTVIFAHPSVSPTRALIQKHENIKGVPLGASAIIVNFLLTDLNLRRDYAHMFIYQEGNDQNKTNLTNKFMVGPHPLPPFGMSTEVTLPWVDHDRSKNSIILEVWPHGEKPS
jgi:hypothetical protein